MFKLARKSRGGIYFTVNELAPHGDESVDFLVNDKVVYHAGDLTVPTRLDSGMDMHQGPSVFVPKPDNANNDDAEDHHDDPMNGKEEKTSGVDLQAIERELLQRHFRKDDDSGEVD